MDQAQESFHGMKQHAAQALDTATHRGASYADVRLIETREQQISVRNDRVQVLEHRESRGFGIRVIANGAWGFASSCDLTTGEIDRIAALAVQIAKASAQVHQAPVILAPLHACVDTYHTPVRVNPFDSVSMEDKLNLLFRAQHAMPVSDRLKHRQASMMLWNDRKTFASTAGSYIEQDTYHSGAGVEAEAVEGDDLQVRSYPNSFGGDYQAGGFEVIQGFDLVAHAPRVADQAVALLSAKQCPAGVTTVVMDGSQLSLQIHESCGHPSELDRVLGTEANFAGTSFLTLDQLGVLRYGSPLVNLVADATYPGGLGTFGYDDEGVPAQQAHLVKDGVLVGYMSSRETAPIIGASSNGTMRADGWQNIPLIRMTNINLLPGGLDIGLEEIIADTDEGIYMETNRSWSIDDKRLNFQFGTEIGWEIKGGKLGNMVKNPTYTGITPRFWGGCDLIGGQKAFYCWGTPNCGKGQPEQTMRTAQGAAPARFRNVQVGVGYKS